MGENWPDKEGREELEINEFIKHYKKLPNGKVLEIIDKCPNGNSGPDYVVRDTITEVFFGIELTSVYLNDRSVPDIHKKPLNGLVSIPYDKEQIEKYKTRLLQAIKDKIKKAYQYDKSYPLILSVYVNEYVSIHMDREDFESLVRANEGLFDRMWPFSEIVFWPLPNGGVFSVKP